MFIVKLNDPLPLVTGDLVACTNDIPETTGEYVYQVTIDAGVITLNRVIDFALIGPLDAVAAESRPVKTALYPIYAGDPYFNDIYKRGSQDFYELGIPTTHIPQ